MSFNLENVPATFHSCEMHGKRAKRSDGEAKAPAREKKVTVTLDVTDDKFSAIIDECWPGSKLLIREMAGHDSHAQDLVGRKKMGDVRFRVRSAGNGQEVLAIAVARAQGFPTLRIGKRAEKVQLSMRVVGPIASDRLDLIDQHCCDADVFVDVGMVQTTIDDVIDDDDEDTIDAAVDEAGDAVVAMERAHKQRGGKGRGKASKVSVHVNGEQIALTSPEA